MSEDDCGSGLETGTSCTSGDGGVERYIIQQDAEGDWISRHPYISCKMLVIRHIPLYTPG